jgi:hypothetical protein
MLNAEVMVIESPGENEELVSTAEASPCRPLRRAAPRGARRHRANARKPSASSGPEGGKRRAKPKAPRRPNRLVFKWLATTETEVKVDRDRAEHLIRIGEAVKPNPAGQFGRDLSPPSRSVDGE